MCLIVSKANKKINVKVNIPKGVSEIEVQIESDRNKSISKFTDVSHHNPEHKQTDNKKESQKEIWFPIVDVILEKGMECVAIFDNVKTGECYINGMFHKEKRRIENELAIPIENLENWENAIFMNKEKGILKQFVVKQKFKVIKADFQHEFNLLSEVWSGKISVYSLEENQKKILSTKVIAPLTLEPTKQKRENELSFERLEESLKDTLEYILASQNKNPNSPTYKGLYLFYDHDAHTYRTSQWIWTWGPSVKLLLDSSNIPAIESVFGREYLRTIAKEIGSCSLKFQMKDENHPANGLITVRWNPTLDFSYGYKQCLSTADTNFLSGWAWIPLYETIGDIGYLNAAKELTLSTERLVNEFGIAPQDYIVNTETWTDHVLDESGFTLEGIAEIYRVTNDEKYMKIGKKCMDLMIKEFQREDGLWERMWCRSARKSMPSEYMLRGLGWAMEGLLAAYRMIPDETYLNNAIKMADNVMSWQHSDGCWSFKMNQSIDKIGVGEKGTALWSLLFYNLYNITKNNKHLNTARKALKWCLSNQYYGMEKDARGGILGCSPQSGVVYREWFNMSCTYTSAFFGLAVIEEMKIQS